LLATLKSKQADDAYVDLFVKNIMEVIEFLRGGNKVAYESAHWQPISFGSRIWDDDVPEAHC